MPWEITSDHPDCDAFAVVKTDDGSLEACHDTRESAEEHREALYAAEAEAGAPMDGINLVYVELEGLTEGKPFDALMAGEFVDMRGREVEIDEDDLADFVANTKALIAEHKERGLDGLPIDAKKHEKGDAAGWITDVLLEDGRLRIVPKWTQLGLEKIEKGIQKLFSATLDPIDKIIFGGTLTNWPAVPGLRAIELSEGAYHLQEDESLDDQVRAVRDAWHTQFDFPMPHTGWVQEVFDDHVIIERNGKLWRVTYDNTNDGITFAERDQWVEVRQTYVEAVREFVGRMLSIFGTENNSARGNESDLDGRGDSDGATETNEEPEETEVFEVELTQEQLEERLDAMLEAKFNELIAAKAGAAAKENGDGDDVDPLELFDLEEQVGDIEKALTERQLEIYHQLEERAEQQALRKLQQIRHKQNVAELAHQLTAGTEEAPRAFRQDTETLEEMLLALPRDQYQAWANFLQHAQDHGLAEFEEIGHGRRLEGTAPVPDEFKPQIDQWVEAGKPARQWFELNADLVGDPKQYDLSEWEDKDNG